nr:MAG TPA: adenine-specific methyltransferase [Caudoviricetes sp.]
MSLNKGYLIARTDKASDEVYTPYYAVEPLIKYLTHFNTIWCPFDTKDSEYVKCFQQIGKKIIYSHIQLGEDFFSYEPGEYDIIISNPPFSLKDEVIKRLYYLNKPYAILLPLPSLQGQSRFPFIKDCEALIFDKRINYYKDKDKTEVQKGVSFASFYLCRNFLPEKLIFEKLNP